MASIYQNDIITVSHDDGVITVTLRREPKTGVQIRPTRSGLLIHASPDVSDQKPEWLPNNVDNRSGFLLR
jgi:hypothetical protein